MNETARKQAERLLFGAHFTDRAQEATARRELEERLAESMASGRPMRVYAGYDPSRPDIHLGHSITMRKLREFQDLGHDVTFVVGTFTAQVGDTSDKTTGRPRRSEEEVRAAAASYADQAFRILDREKTTVVYNADWLAKLTLGDVVTLASHFTVQQFLVRDNYRLRIEKGNPVGLHEFLYPLLQGYDAMYLRADVQLGATEQLFNMLAGRKLQEAHGHKPCICITFPILVGTDGTARMSKSTGNTVGITDPPNEQFGKTMSISDDTMIQWMGLVTRWSPDEVAALVKSVRDGAVHPMDAKKRLAREIVSMYHGDAAAAAAQADFELRHQQRETPAPDRTHTITGPTPIVTLLTDLGIAASRNKARQLIDGGAVKIDGVPVTTHEHVVSTACVLQSGRRTFVAIVVAG